MAEIILTSENFEKEVLKSDIPVLVDFFATWCGPCKMIAPIVEEIAKEKEGKIKVCKLDVDEATEIAIKYKVNMIPTLILFEDGKESEKKVGYLTKEELLEMLPE